MLRSGAYHLVRVRAPRLWVRRLAPAFVLIAPLGCFRFGYDASDGPGSGGAFGGLVETGTAGGGGAPLGSEGAADLEPVRDASWLPTRSRMGAGGADASSPDAGGIPPGEGLRDAGFDAGSGGTGAAVAACRLGNQSTVQQFDGPTSLVTARGSNASVMWTGSEGNPAPGALDFKNPAGGSAELFSPGLTGNLSHHVMLLNVEVASGSNVRMRLFVETGASAQRGRGAYVTPPGGQWACTSLDFDNPDTADSGYDARSVTGAGLEVEGSGSVEVYVDQIAY
ncbi:MAG TPA: hypothetical protein VG963_01180 [Polyangiaceae bacterium]|nr:hypothetical protein [Polyangiaceae bacterium]